MRKIILIAFVCALSLKTQAQTNFQPLGYTDVLDLAKKKINMFLSIFIRIGVHPANGWQKMFSHRKKSGII